MKMLTQCPICSMKDPIRSLLLVDVADNGIIAICCEAGHNSDFFMQTQKFEILFDMGAMAFIDGYHRESVATFAAALERLLEFYVHAVLREQGLEEVEFEKTWKEVNSQSERQLGAFLFVRLLTKKKALQQKYLGEKIGSDNATEFRNKVIHKGYIPTRDEAYKYGEIVFKYMNSIVNDMVSSAWSGITVILEEKNQEIEKKYPKIARHSHPTIISLHQAWFRNQSTLFPVELPATAIELMSESPDFNTALERFEKYYRSFLYPSSLTND